MFIDLLHNYIVKSTITEKFSESVEKKLLPRLEAEYGASLLGIQMYEDYKSDAFYIKGEWYYPLTVILATGPRTQWVKWKMKNGNFKDGQPYAYIGEGLLDINLASDIPAEFAERLADRAICSTANTIKVNIETPAPDPTILAGKYSQTFVDEMARQLTEKISSAMSISGLESGGISLSLVFAPGTYMEHTSENVTYRRLLMSDNASAPRDFWVKWTREDGAMAYKVSDHVNAETIVFEIGEDVPQKYREKEYRFLLSSGGDKYHNAMGRKNITEWRELIKRAVRRGDLVKIETITDTSSGEDVTARLAAIIGKDSAQKTASETVITPPVENVDFVHAMEVARSIAIEHDEGIQEKTVTETPATEADVIEEVADISFISENVTVEETPVITTVFDAVYATDEESAEMFEEIDDEEILEADDAEIHETVPEISKLKEAAVPARESLVTEEASPISVEEMEAKIRAEIEAKMRLEYETRARLEAEAEAEKLRLATEELRRQNQKLIEEAEAERRRLVEEAEARRAELEEQIRREAKDKERLAEAAKIALDAARRDEEERAKAEALAKAKADEAARIESERLAAEEKARKAKEAEALAGHVRSKNYTYTSKSVRFLFRRTVDPNITSRIYEIIKTTLEYYGKDKMYMRIKAKIPDTTTVVLEFVEFPMEEMALLSNIIKVLGNSGLGIAKAIVE